jgi:tRNA U55 pseudouridine synthase TruB
MSELVRTEIGPFHIETAVDPRGLDAVELARALQPPQYALAEMPQLVLNEQEIACLANGRFLSRPWPRAARGSLLVALNPNNEMVAVLKRRPDEALCPYINFVGKG